MDIDKEIEEGSVLCLKPDVEWCVEQAISSGTDWNPLNRPWIAEAQGPPRPADGMIECVWLTGTLFGAWRKTDGGAVWQRRDTVEYLNINLILAGKIGGKTRGEISATMVPYEEEYRKALKALDSDDSDEEKEL